MAHPVNVQSIPPRPSPELAVVLERYAAAWQRTLDSVAFPQPDPYLQFVDEDSQPELRALLEGIDDQFRSRLATVEAEPTRPNWTDGTVIGPPPAPEAGPGDEPQQRQATALVRPEDPLVGATASFAAAAEKPSTRVRSGSAAQPLTDEGRHAPTVIGRVDPDGDGPHISGDIELTPRTTVRGQAPRMPSVPGYEILGVLGRGGMGVVYRARQTGLNRVVALKMILAGEHAAPEHVARFKTEAEAVAQLQHPNIVQIFDIGTADGLPYFSLEFVDGRSLEQERDAKPLPVDRAARMVVTLARAMHYAHQRGIVHRDLKPANVLLTADGAPKVTDFGLVKRVEADSSETRTGTIVGTPSYMAPEQAWGKTDIGPAADVYALGAILYTLLTGRPPFLGPTPLETIMQLRKDEPVPPSRLQPNLPRDLETICLKALQKLPESRYADAAALADDLERFLEGAPILARPVGRLERTWRWCRRNPALAASGGAALVLSLCLMIGGPVAAAMIYNQKVQAVSARKQADASALLADEKAREANANAALAQRNEQRAVANEQLAARNAETARQQRDLSIETLNELADRAQNDLKNMPGTQAVRLTLLRRAMDGLNKVSATAGETLRDLVLGRAHRQMGDVLLESGLAKEARTQYEKSHQVVLELVRSADPSKPHVPYLNLGRSYVNLGRAARQMGDAPGAQEYFLQSLKSREAALPLAPDKSFVEQETADSYGQLVSIHLDLGQPDAAIEYQRLGMELRRKWMENAPGNVGAISQFAGAQADLARISLDFGRLPEAVEQYTAAIETLRKVTDVDRRMRGNVALFQSQRGAAWLFAGDAARARDEYAEAAEALEQLSAEDPEHAQLRRMLGSAYYGLGTACLEAGDAEVSRKSFDQCAAIRRTLAEKEPNDRTLQAALMLALARTGDHAEAARLAREIEEHAPQDASLLYIVAGGYALAKAGTANDHDLAAQYAASALSALQRAVDHGYRGVALMRMDPDLDPLRELPEFQKLVADLEQSLARPADQTVKTGSP